MILKRTTDVKEIMKRLFLTPSNLSLDEVKLKIAIQKALKPAGDINLLYIPAIKGVNK